MRRLVSSTVLDPSCHRRKRALQKSSTKRRQDLGRCRHGGPGEILTQEVHTGCEQMVFFANTAFATQRSEASGVSRQGRLRQHQPLQVVC